MTDKLRTALDRVNRTLAGTRDDVETFDVADIMALRDAALAAAPQPATPGQRMIHAAEEAVAIASGEAEPASVYPAETDWGPDVGKEVLPPYQPAYPHERETLVEVIKAAHPWGMFAEDAEHIADALLARGLRLPCGEETMAWAVVEEGKPLNADWIKADRRDAELFAGTRDRVVPVAIRVVDGGDDAA